MSDFHTKTVTELAALLQSGEVSSVQLTSYFLDRIKAHDGRLNSFITVTEDQAMAAAQQADAQIKAGTAGPLTGVPIAHKDIFCTEGVKTSCGSKMLDNFISPYDATVVSKFKQAGVVTLGKTNMDEFAMGSSNETSYYGPVKNPWATDCVLAAPPEVPPLVSPHSWHRLPLPLTPVARFANPPPSVASPV